MNFEIPSKCIPLIKYNVKDEDYIPDNIPEKLKDKISKHIEFVNIDTQNEITKLMICSNKSKKNYSELLCNTYEKLKEEFQKCYEEKSHKYVCRIVGAKSSCWETPSLNGWLESNQTKTEAINLFIEELTTKGYSPRLSINSFTVDHDDGMYYGGDELTVECEI